jgi:hypothetical protein
VPDTDTELLKINIKKGSILQNEIDQEKQLIELVITDLEITLMEK